MSSQEAQAINARLDRIERLTLIGAKDVLDIDEAAMMTGYTKAFLYRLTSSKKIPHYKKCRKLYFKKKELEDWMLDSKVLSGDEINRQATTYISTSSKKKNNHIIHH